jgi:hypothetical protein
MFPITVLQNTLELCTYYFSRWSRHAIEIIYLFTLVLLFGILVCFTYQLHLEIENNFHKINMDLLEKNDIIHHLTLEKNQLEKNNQKLQETCERLTSNTKYMQLVTQCKRVYI